ncbi:unnamed protein product [Rhizophagus irregularis]|nr:unnamed protein product [Rhizophagus irregularis]CAB4406121.1 unnamed protein product [Rhizophagus irregularis]
MLTATAGIRECPVFSILFRSYPFQINSPIIVSDAVNVINVWLIFWIRNKGFGCEGFNSEEIVVSEISKVCCEVNSGLDQILFVVTWFLVYH